MFECTIFVLHFILFMFEVVLFIRVTIIMCAKIYFNIVLKKYFTKFNVFTRGAKYMINSPFDAVFEVETPVSSLYYVYNIMYVRTCMYILKM